MPPDSIPLVTPMAILLSDAMHRCKISRTALADQVGVSPEMISNIKSGVSALPCERVEGFAKALNIPVLHMINVGVASYENQGWRAMGIAMRLRLADLVPA